MSQDFDLSKEAQEEMWLDDLKALLDDDAPAASASYPAAQNRAPYGGFPMQAPGAAPRQNGTPYPGFGVPAQTPGQQGNPYAAAAQRLYSQQPYEQPVWQQPAPRAAQQQKPAKARKPSAASIVFLCILVILESAGIGAVAYSWLQWMH